MIDPPTPSSGKPDYPEIGERLRRHRLEKGLSIRRLAEKIGLSASLISQIERSQSNPSVATLYAIANELDVSLDELLFNDRRPASPPGLDSSAPVPAPPVGPPRHPVQEVGSRKSIRLASGVTWERLTTTSEPDVEFLHVVYEVGGASSSPDAFQRHPGHEWGYVISGELQVTIGFDQYVLHPGDAVSLASTIPHRLANVGDEPVHAIWFVLGRVPVEPESEDGEVRSPGSG